jgi:hypothetical protein
MANHTIRASNFKMPLNFRNGRRAAMITPEVDNEVEDCLLAFRQHDTINFYTTSRADVNVAAI